MLAQIYTWRGQHSEAVAAWQEVIRLGDRSPDAQILLGTAYASAGQTENTQAILKRLEKGKEDVSPAAMALLHASMGDREQALSLLEGAFSTHDQR